MKPPALLCLQAVLMRMARSGLIPAGEHINRADGRTPLAELGVDSLGKLTLLAELEVAMDLDLSVTEFAGARNLGDIAVILSRKQAGGEASNGV